MNCGQRVFLYYGDALRRYAFGQGHPFGSDRIDAFWEEACRRGLDCWVEIREPAEATRAVLERFHAPEYLDRLRQLSALGTGMLDFGDTPVFPGIYEAAAAVVGTTVAACEALMAGECRSAFVPVAGLHHASRGAASGFCALNDCGVAIETLKTQHHLERIAYVDIDVHHADGVFYAFEEDPAVIFETFTRTVDISFRARGWKRSGVKGPGKARNLTLPWRHLLETENSLPPGSGSRLSLMRRGRSLCFFSAVQTVLRASRLPTCAIRRRYMPTPQKSSCASSSVTAPVACS